MIVTMLVSRFQRKESYAWIVRSDQIMTTSMFWWLWFERCNCLATVCVDCQLLGIARHWELPIAVDLSCPLPIAHRDWPKAKGRQWLDWY